jgi:hypothetical protein
MQYLENYHHFLRGISDVAEFNVKSLWDLENYSSNLFERSAVRTTLDRYFQKL